MEAKQQDRPPDESAALARWFAEGVRDELAALEKDAKNQRFEVLSGRLLEGIGPGEAIFEFILADPSRLPEDATGRLKTQSDEYTAQVIGQLDNRIQLRLQGMAPLHLVFPGPSSLLMTRRCSGGLRKSSMKSPPNQTRSARWQRRRFILFAHKWVSPTCRTHPL